MNNKIDELLEMINKLENEIEIVKQQRDAYKESHLALLDHNMSKADDK